VTTTLAGNANAVFGTTIGYQANTDRPTTATRDDGLIEEDVPDAVSGEINEHKSNAHAVAPVTTMQVLQRDAQGRVLRWRDADQREHARTFDSLGRLATSTPAGQATVTYAYQGGGDRVDTVSNAVDGTRQFTYHPLGGVRSVLHDSVEEQAADFDQDGRVMWTRTKGVTRSTSYDPITGVVASATAPDGTTTYHRNGRGLVTRIDYPGANRSVVLEYDANERLAKRTYADATFEEVVYDANGDVQKTRDRAGSWTTVVASGGSCRSAPVCWSPPRLTSRCAASWSTALTGERFCSPSGARVWGCGGSKYFCGVCPRWLVSTFICTCYGIPWRFICCVGAWISAISKSSWAMPS
jgi:YD repeat-containing protein